MVYYSEVAEDDLHDILIGLATWKKMSLSFEQATNYVKDIRKAGNNICQLSYHQNVTYESHRVYGNKVYRYKRSASTMWYIIYDWNEVKKIAYVNKIMSNYLTVGD